MRALVLGALAALSIGCGTAKEAGELERLRQEKARLEAEVERLRAENRRLRGQPETPSALAHYFVNDARAGTLAGLAPGDFVEKARSLYGPETRMNVYESGEPESQYEWELVGGITLRLSADQRGRVFRVGAVLDTAQPIAIPTLEGVTLGRDTYANINRKFGPALWTNLHIWGVRDIYTVAQTLPRGRERSWQLQFAYEIPRGLSAEQLRLIQVEVGKKRNVDYLMQFVADRLPYLVVLEEPR